MRGFLLVDKPAGPTSHDVVAQIRKRSKCRRVGHCGTLDPGATGLLVLALEEATRLAKFATFLAKEYRVKAVLGVATSTDDAQGEVLEEQERVTVSEAEVRQVVERFRGSQKQVPPMVSALHHKGRRLYELAREGQWVEREARKIEVSELELLAFHQGGHPILDLRMVVSAGTYVRTLCADIGKALEIPAHAAEIRRTRVGAWRAEDALSLEIALEMAGTGALERALIPIEQADLGLPVVTLSKTAVGALLRGTGVRALPKQGVVAGGQMCLAAGPSGRIVALCRSGAGGEGGVALLPERLLVATAGAADED